MIDTKKPPTVALIGCGPSGMFFLHALAVRRARLEEEGDADGLASLPVVTCFERSSGPGGVWRSNRSFEGDRGRAGNDASEPSTSMYEALWTNGPKETMEFFDHTYREHFGRATPMFLPRARVLEYLLTRCTKNNERFFDDVRFNTCVERVRYDEGSEKFVVNLCGKEGESSSSFDVCIWAAGENGRPHVPSRVDDILKCQGFRGRVMHSSQTDSSFDLHVRGKNVVLVGASSSAEDLALMAIKLGARGVDIVSRSGVGDACKTASWPMDKVRVHKQMTLVGVADGGRGVVLARTELDLEEVEYVTEEGGILTTLEDVATVIYCTGYERNFDMLDEGLRPKLPYFETTYSEDEFPEDWRMSKNVLSEELGDVPPGEITPAPAIVQDDMYRGRLISIPSMYFMFEQSEFPLLNFDIAAWRTLAMVTGDLPLPPPEEMERFNMETLLDAMDDPWFRFDSDSNYYMRWKTVIDDPDNHWLADASDDRVKSFVRNYTDLQFRFLARDASDSGYPLDIGTFEGLNERGATLVNSSVVADLNRWDMEKSSPDASWRTFRDGDPSGCRSVFTGEGAVPFGRRWLDLEGCEVADIVDNGRTEGGEELADHAAAIPANAATAADLVPEQEGDGENELRDDDNDDNDNDAEARAFELDFEDCEVTDIVVDQTEGGEERDDCCVEVAAGPAKVATAAVLVREREGDGENDHRDDDATEAHTFDVAARRPPSP